MASPLTLNAKGRKPRELHSDDAEEATLSAMLQSNAAIRSLAVRMRAEDFWSARNGKVFAAIVALDAGGAAADLITVTEELKRCGDLDFVGGQQYVCSLLDGAPIVVNVDYHAGIVIDFAKQRAAVRALEETAGLIRSGEIRVADLGQRLGPALQSLATTAEKAAQPFPIVHIMHGAAPVPPTQLVAGLLLDRDINLFSGHGGSAKTVTMLEVAMAVALGRRVFGTLQVNRPGPVLLVLPEDGEGPARMMLDAIAAGAHLDNATRELLAERIVMIPDDTTVNITTDAARLAATAASHSAVLVAFDPLSNLLAGASERDEDVATTVCQALRATICRDAGASVLMNTHLRKPGKDSGPETATTVHDLRGSGGWGNSARLVFTFSKKDESIHLVGVKANRLKVGIRHDLKLSIHADPADAARWVSCSLVDANLGAQSEALTPGVGRQINTNERAALAFVDDTHEPGRRLSWAMWEKGVGLNPNTFKSIRDRLVKHGLVSAIQTGKKTRNGSPEYAYAITDNGRAALVLGSHQIDSKGEGVSYGE